MAANTLRKEEASSCFSYEDDAAREDTSVRGVLSPSDWGSTFGVADVMGGGADSVVTTHHPNRTPSEANNNKKGQTKAKKNKQPDGNNNGNNSRSSWKLFQWWSDLISRASRSATSLLNQHSPNLNDILDGNEENVLAAANVVVSENRRGGVIIITIIYYTGR